MPTERALPKPGDFVGGKYRVERTLGSGGMGVVFEVSHRVTNKRFAVKWLLPEIAANEGAVKRFIREAQVAGRFEHPNVVEVYDIGQDAESFYMVMELLEGESLGDRLERVRRLSPQQACEILVPCMDGVAAAHEAGIIHRDLKPANIFLCEARNRQSEQPKVLDFGISKLSSLQGVPDATLTQAGVVIGTPHYMAPEQMRALAVDARADVYAFGVILYQALSGSRPFDGDSYVDLMLQVLNEAPKPLRERAPEVPAQLASVVERAMARDPAARYPDLHELSRALAPFHRAPSVQPVSHSTRPDAATARLPQPSAATNPPTPLSSESIPSPSPFDRLSHRAQLWIAGAFAAALVVAFVAAVFSRPDTSLVRGVRAREPSAALHQVQPASAAPKAEEMEPLPITVRIEPEPAEQPRIWVAPDMQPQTTPQAQPAPPTAAPTATEPAPAAVEPRRPTHRSAAKKKKAAFTPRVQLEMGEFTD